jgi:hypothetical protein
LLSSGCIYLNAATDEIVVRKLKIYWRSIKKMNVAVPPTALGSLLMKKEQTNLSHLDSQKSAKIEALRRKYLWGILF